MKNPILSLRKLFSTTAALALLQVLPSAEALELKHLSTADLGGFDEGAAEIVAFDAATKQIFAINAERKSITVVDASDPAALKEVKDLDISEQGKAPTCIAVYGDLVAATVENEDKQANGKIVFFSTAGDFLCTVEAGALPDNLHFSPDGKYLVAANEGEPSDDYKNDPEGSVTIVDTSGGAAGIKDAKVWQVSLAKFNDAELPEYTRIFGPEATVAMDLEPEYVAVSPDSKTAYIILQENNAVLMVDLESKEATAIASFGVKDHSKEGNGFDASDKSDKVDIRPWPVLGFYMPDAAVAAEIGGKTYLLTANEGDSRDYDGYSEEVRVKDLKLDAEKYPNAAELQAEDQLGRLKTTTANGDTDGDGDFDQIYSYGARSFAIWDAEGGLVYDSGDVIEQYTAKELGEGFNATNDEQPSFKNRSDDKGPEPEAIDTGVIDGKTYAFVGLERVSGVIVFDITDPTAPKVVGYGSNRDHSAPIDTEAAGDIGPECVVFVPADKSPNGKNILIVSNEVSGTVSTYEVVTE